MTSSISSAVKRIVGGKAAPGGDGKAKAGAKTEAPQQVDVKASLSFANYFRDQLQLNPKAEKMKNHPDLKLDDAGSIASVTITLTGASLKEYNKHADGWGQELKEEALKVLDKEMTELAKTLVATVTNLTAEDFANADINEILQAQAETFRAKAQGKVNPQVEKLVVDYLAKTHKLHKMQAKAFFSLVLKTSAQGVAVAGLAAATGPGAIIIGVIGVARGVAGMAGDIFKLAASSTAYNALIAGQLKFLRWEYNPDIAKDNKTGEWKKFYGDANEIAKNALNAIAGANALPTIDSTEANIKEFDLANSKLGNKSRELTDSIAALEKAFEKLRNAPADKELEDPAKLQAQVAKLDAKIKDTVTARNKADANRAHCEGNHAEYATAIAAFDDSNHKAFVAATNFVVGLTVDGAFMALDPPQFGENIFNDFVTGAGLAKDAYDKVKEAVEVGETVKAG